MMTKRSSILLVLSLLTTMLLAQGVGDSPYSYLGIGQINSKGFALNRSLGGLGVGLNSSHYLNGINPAGLSGMDTMSFTFEVGLSGNVTQLSSPKLSEDVTNGGIDYLAVGFPISRWWKSSVGFEPFSQVGYNIIQQKTVDDGVNEAYQLKRSIKGSGGFNQIYWANAFQPIKSLAIGVQVGYLFGNKTNTIFDKPLESHISVSQLQNVSVIKVSDVYYKFGLQYYHKINDKYSFVLGTTFSNQSALNTEAEFRALSFSTGHPTDTLFDRKVTDYKVDIPSVYGFGASFSSEKWTLGIDYTTGLWSKIKGNTPFVDSESIIVGVEYVPNLRIATKYYHKIRYRLSTYYNKRYVQYDGESLKEFGINIGVGLPVKRSKTTLNLSFDFGKVGTANKNHLKETYYGFKLNISMHDIWFMKRRYD